MEEDGGSLFYLLCIYVVCTNEPDFYFLLILWGLTVIRQAFFHWFKKTLMKSS